MLGVFVHLFDADIFPILPFTFSAIHLAAPSVNIHLALSAQGSLDTLKKQQQHKDTVISDDDKLLGEQTTITSQN